MEIRKNLTPNQIEKMKRLRTEGGLSNVEIAREMSTSVATVYNHIGNQPAIMSRMNRELYWKHRSERFATRKAIAAQLHLEEMERRRLEAERRKKVEAAQALVRKRNELNATKARAVQELEKLKAELSSISEQADESERFLEVEAMKEEHRKAR